VDDDVHSVLRLAAEAIGVSTDAVAPALAAAFARARDLGLDVHTVAERLNRAHGS